MIGKHLKSIRQNNKCPQKKVAGAMGVPVTTYANWEQDAADPPLAQFVRLADFFGCSADDLLGRFEPDASGLSEAVAPLSLNQKKLLAAAIAGLSRGGGALVHARLFLFVLFIYIYWIETLCAAHIEPHTEPHTEPHPGPLCIIKKRLNMSRCAYRGATP